MIDPLFQPTVQKEQQKQLARTYVRSYSKYFGNIESSALNLKHSPRKYGHHLFPNDLSNIYAQC